jgi:glutaredoxin 3
VTRLELYGTSSCPYTAELRESLEWRQQEYLEYDVEADPAALARMLRISGGQRSVPILIEEGKVIQIGWQGHSCVVG